MTEERDLDARARDIQLRTFTRRPKCDKPTDTTPCLLERGHRGDCKGRPTIAQIVAFEAEQAGTRVGLKEERIRIAFGISAPRYYQLLHHYITTEEAHELDPITVHRVLRTSAAAVTARQSHQFPKPS